jgi:endonuclease-8
VPEGNEIHRYADLQAEMFEGRKLTVEAPNGRFATGAARLNRRKLISVDAYGKHLFYNFGVGRHLHVHLGLYGKFRDGAMPFPETKGALRLRFSTPDHWLELRGPTACDVLGEEARQKLIDRIGPDPLGKDAKPKTAFTYIVNSRTPIGALLMDQSVIGGIGNIYRAELLFRAKLNPFQPGKTVPETKLRSLWKDAKRLMQAGMVDRRIVTTRPSDRPHPTAKARAGETHYVYRRTGLPCFICNTEIRAKEFVGRKVYWCPTCQPEVR